MAPYFRTEPDLLLCPSARKHRPPPGISPPWGGGGRSAWKHGGFVASYGLNNWTGALEEARQRREGDPSPLRWETPLVPQAQGVPVFLDCMFGGGSPMPENGPPPREDVHRGIPGGCSMGHFCIDRHDGHINSLFLDWSARKVGLKELWTLKWHREYDTTGPWTKAGGVQPEDWPEWMRRFKDY